MINLDKALADFNAQYGRTIVFDPSDQTFYESTGTQRRVVRLAKPICSPIPQIPDRVHFSSEATHTASDEALEAIVIEQVKTAVCQNLAKQGLMQLCGDHYKPCQMGVCHVIWADLKKILNEKYGINWMSPQDRNPTVMYD